MPKLHSHVHFAVKNIFNLQCKIALFPWLVYEGSQIIYEFSLFFRHLSLKNSNRGVGEKKYLKKFLVFSSKRHFHVRCCSEEIWIFYKHCDLRGLQMPFSWPTSEGYKNFLIIFPKRHSHVQWCIAERIFEIYPDKRRFSWLVYEETFENGGKSAPNSPTGEWGAFHKNKERSWCRMNA